MEGIVTKVQSYLENDRLVYVYTPLGFRTLIAKGSQKLTSNSRILAQYLTHIEFKETPNKNMFILSEGKILNLYESIKKDYKLINDASIMFDLVEIFLTTEENHKDIYQLLKDALENFKKESALSFSFKLLRYLGYPLNLKPDGRKVKGFSIREAKIIYVGENLQCDLNLTLTTILLKLTHLPYDKIDEIEEAYFNKLKSFMYQYYEYHTDTLIKRK
ncbi:DNA repair protein RecO [Acholeplasma equirhinis]|uniref:DNA repair protein RecO n=1 Tax=Acholeplasma equirhinis TaxID=555393 RepID=UPI00197A758E|nr:DNA repair protein RecO [Acholeplasma equirhinis]MBN3490066.1 DNA repair protein RecO [Acholeplasma equirhinis]